MISVIIPTYNSAQTLAFTLNSIVNQTVTDFEILIIDGLSTDSTLSIAKSYNDERIKIISEKDAGIYDAMNKGIQIAQGEWLYFLGSDDELYNKNVFFELSLKLKHLDVEVLYGNVISTRFGGVYDGEFDSYKILQKNICHQAIFFKKEIFKKVGLYKLKYKTSADWEHNVRWFFSKKIKKYYIDNIIAIYADGGYSSTQNDNIFATQKVTNYLVNCKNEISINYKIGLIVKELRISLQWSEKERLIYLLLRLPRILLKI